MKRLLFGLVALLIASFPAAVVAQDSLTVSPVSQAVSSEPAKWLFFMPAVGAQVTGYDEGETGGLVVDGIFRLKDMPRYWPEVVGLSFAMNGGPDPSAESDEPTPPGNTLGLAGWWLPLEGGPLKIGFGGGGVLGNFGGENTDLSGLYGLAVMLSTGESSDLFITLVDHTDFQDWAFDFQGRIEYVRDFDLGIF